MNNLERGTQIYSAASFNGVKPIAVGDVLRHLASCLCCLIIRPSPLIFSYLMGRLVLILGVWNLLFIPLVASGSS